MSISPEASTEATILTELSDRTQGDDHDGPCSVREDVYSPCEEHLDKERDDGCHSGVYRRIVSRGHHCDEVANKPVAKTALREFVSKSGSSACSE